MRTQLARTLHVVREILRTIKLYYFKNRRSFECFAEQQGRARGAWEGFMLVKMC